MGIDREIIGAVHAECQKTAEWYCSTGLLSLICEYDEFLKEHDYPIIGREDFFHVPLPVTNEAERGYIRESAERLLARLEPYYTTMFGRKITEVIPVVSRAKKDEIRRLNEHLVYKIDNKNTWLYIYGNFFN